MITSSRTGELTYLHRLHQATTALASALCIVLSLSFYKHYNPKTDLPVPFLHPDLCRCGVYLDDVLRNLQPQPKRDHLLPVLSLYSLGVGADIKAAGARVRLPFLFVEVCCWGLAGLMLIYSSLVVCFSVLTAITFDRDVWFRDITGSPSPFPVVLGVYTLKLWLAENAAHAALPPGCTCKEKVPPPSPPTALPPLGLQSGPRGNNNLASAQSAVPGVRVPTALERQNSIFVGLDV
ncbi:hypothetical protein EDB87DRAFT_1702271 [Lactarius vividus]|nr:hypothetical protein EDB87DRAFT_1702271 [Lactarius vividus]